jgi:hypothetical protein
LIARHGVPSVPTPLDTPQEEFEDEKFVVMVSTALALMVTGVSTASAEQVGPEGPSQPLLSGDINGEEPHGVLHCQTISAILAPELKKGPATTGVIVGTKGGKFHLAAPAGGVCEQVFHIFE